MRKIGLGNEAPSARAAEFWRQWWLGKRLAGVPVGDLETGGVVTPSERTPLRSVAPSMSTYVSGDALSYVTDRRPVEAGLPAAALGRPPSPMGTDEYNDLMERVATWLEEPRETPQQFPPELEAQPQPRGLRVRSRREDWESPRPSEGAPSFTRGRGLTGSQPSVHPTIRGTENALASAMAGAIPSGATPSVAGSVDSGGTVPSFRLRRRGRETNELFRMLVGDLATLNDTSGLVDWTSPFALGTWFRSVFGDEARLRAVMRVGARGAGWANYDEPRDDVGDPNPIDPARGSGGIDWLATVTLRGSTEPLQISIRLVSRLINWMAYRPRDRGTLLALRARSVGYAKELEMPAERLTWVIHGSLVVAFILSDVESRTYRLLGQRSGERVVPWSQRVLEGVLRDGGLRWVLHTLLGVGCFAVLPLSFVPHWVWTTIGQAMVYPPMWVVAWILIGTVAFASRPRRTLALARA
jgi:hypothetical protein